MRLNSVGDPFGFVGSGLRLDPPALLVSDLTNRHHRQPSFRCLFWMSTPATLRPPLDGSGLRPDPPALLVSDLTGHHESPLFPRFRMISKFNRKPFQPPPPCGHLPQIGVATFGGGWEGASFSAPRWVWSPTRPARLPGLRPHKPSSKSALNSEILVFLCQPECHFNPRHPAATSPKLA